MVKVMFFNELLLVLVVGFFVVVRESNAFSIAAPKLRDSSPIHREVNIFINTYSRSQLLLSNNRRLWQHRYSTPSTAQPQREQLSMSPSSSVASSNSGSESNLPRIKRKLSREFLDIAVPAFVQLTAEPLASLVDTAYLGRLGPEVLGGAGVAISAQYAVSKLYNDPLLRTSISLVASQDGRTRSNQRNSTIVSEINNEEDNKKELSIAVSSALVLAFVIGVVQMFLYGLFATGIIRGMGVNPASPMWPSAVSYLQVRALGTPAATLWLVTNGVFRGLGDTKTPLIYALVFTALNAILDPLFIFVLHFGASGAAAGTALAQYVALIPLLLALNRRVPVDILGQVKALRKSLQAYLEAGVLVLFRTLGKVLAYAVCARQVALLGPIEAAAYSMTFQLGFATTQVCEAIAVAVQTLLARELADTKTHSAYVRSKLIRHLINTSICVGGGVATMLSLTTYLQRSSILRGLTTNLDVYNCALKIFPAVLVTQVLKGLAYPVNGIIMGGLDWSFTMSAMWLANVTCLAMVFFTRSSQGIARLASIWWALAAFMGMQVVTGILRYESKTGVWNVLRGKT